MADDSIRSDRDTPPGWLQRLHEEELSGFAFAFKARAIALGAVFIWLVFSSSWTRLPVMIAAMALFFVVGWIGYTTRKNRHMLVIQAVCALMDVAIIVLASHYPEHDWYEWALQSWLRRSAFLYLVAYVAASALTFSVKIVLVTGAAASRASSPPSPSCSIPPSTSIRFAGSRRRVRSASCASSSRCRGSIPWCSWRTSSSCWPSPPA